MQGLVTTTIVQNKLLQVIMAVVTLIVPRDAGWPKDGALSLEGKTPEPDHPYSGHSPHSNTRDNKYRYPRFTTQFLCKKNAHSIS